jgi:hypothetical protein
VSFTISISGIEQGVSVGDVEAVFEEELSTGEVLLVGESSDLDPSSPLSVLIQPAVISIPPAAMKLLRFMV